MRRFIWHGNDAPPTAPAGTARKTLKRGARPREVLTEYFQDSKILKWNDVQPPYIHKIEKIILFIWNRTYPADTFLPLDLNEWVLEWTEDFVGYSTKFGDSAGDFSPLSNLLVHEVIQIGHELNIPADLLDKVPSDGLCGKTDEDNLGFTYAQLDSYISNGTCGIEEIDKKISALNRRNLHKLAPMPSYCPILF